MQKYVLRVGLLVGFVSLFVVSVGAAADVIQVQLNDTQLDLPDKLTFQIRASSAAPIDRVALRYGSNGRSCQEGEARQALQFDPQTSVDLEWDWEFRRSGSLPLGAEVWWEWEVRDTASNSLTTERQTRHITDDRYTWQQLSRANLIVRWVRGDNAFGRYLLDTSEQSLNRIAVETGLKLTDPIQVFVYPSAEDIKDMILYLPEWTGGVAFPEYNAVIMGIGPGQRAWAAEVIPHELMHLVSGALVFNCTGVAMPTWLNEGLSVYAEHSRTAADSEPIKKLVLAGELPPLRSLSNGFSAYTDAALTSYSQSAEVVTYLIETYGADKMTALIATMREGTPTDEALESVYGFDVDGLDAEWRRALAGEAAPTLAPATPTSVRLTPTAVPTLALANPVGGKPTPTAAPTEVAAATLGPSATTVAARATPEPADTASAPTINPPGASLPAWLIGGGALLVCGALVAVLGVGAGIAFVVLRRKER
jgi:hypothetical protein